MAIQAGELKYKISADVDKSSFNKLKDSLYELQTLTFPEIGKINNTNLNKSRKILDSIQKDAEAVSNALDSAFNTKLGTVNLSEFQKALKGIKFGGEEAGNSISAMYNSFSRGGAVGKAAFRNLITQVSTANVKLRESHTLLDKMANTLGNTVKWTIASTALNTLTGSLQQAWGFSKALNSSLNNIRIVTGKSADEMARFAQTANQVAKELGTSTTDYTNAALIYAQQGLSDKEVEARAKITLKAANVTGQSTDAVSEQLTAVWNGYKVTAEEAELYIDRLAAVAATTASNLEELSTGMSKVASAAYLMGVNEEQLAAQLSTIISATRQAPETVGTALRTIYARISDIKAGIDEDGVTLGNYSGKMAELGISVLDANGNLREMGGVIEEIGAKWKYMTKEQQVNLAQTMAGQRQYSNLLALFNNFDKYNETLKVTASAEGTLQEQQDTRIESTTAHLNKLKAATEELYMAFGDSSSMHPLIDALTRITELVSNLIKGIGGGGAALKSFASIATVVFSKNIAQGVHTTLKNRRSKKENKERLSETSEWIENLSNNPDIIKDDPETKAVVDELKKNQHLLEVASPDQISAYNKSVTDWQEAMSQRKKAEEEIEQIRKTFTSLLGKQEAKNLESDLISEDGVERITTRLREIKTSYKKFAEEIKEVRNDAFAEESKTLSTEISDLGQYKQTLEKSDKKAESDIKQFEEARLMAVLATKGARAKKLKTMTLGLSQQIDSTVGSTDYQQYYSDEQQQKIRELRLAIAASKNKLENVTEIENVDEYKKHLNELEEYYKTYLQFIKDAEAKIQKQLEEKQKELKTKTKSSSFADLLGSILNDEDAETAGESYKKALNHVYTQASQLLKDHEKDLTQEQLKTLKNIRKRTKEGHVQNGITIDDLANFPDRKTAEEYIKKYFDELEEIIRTRRAEVGSAVKKAEDGVFEEAKKNQEESEQKEFDSRQALKSTMQDLFTETQIQSYVKAAGAVGEVTTGFEGLSNVITILATQGFDLEQIFSTVITSVPMIASGISTLVEVSPQLTILKNKLIDVAKKFALLASEAIKSHGVFGLLKIGVKKLGEAFQWLGNIIKTHPILFIATAILAAITVVRRFLEIQKERIKQENEEAQATLENNKQKQEEIDKNKELYQSLAELNDKYKEGEISRAQVFNTIEDLIKKYNLEEDAVNRLRSSYGDLDDTIRALALEDAKKQTEIAEENLEAAGTLFANAMAEGGKKWKRTGDGVKLDAGYSQGDETAVAKALEEVFAEDWEGIERPAIEIDFDDPSDIYHQYTQLQKVLDTLDEKVKSGSITQKELEKSEYYTGVKDLVQVLKEPAEKYQATQNEYNKHKTEMLAWGSDGGKVDFFNVDNSAGFIEARKALIEKVKSEFGNELEDSGVSEKELVDTFIQENFGGLYSSYGHLAHYISDLETHFNKDITEDVSKEISTLPEDILNIVEGIDPKELAGWDHLQQVIQAISKIDLSNLTVIADSEKAFQNASEQYDFFTSLQEQIANSTKKSISESEFEKLGDDEYLKSFFSKTAKGTYKFTGDEEEFNQAMHDYSIAAFEQNLKAYENSITKLNNLKDSKKENLLLSYDENQPSDFISKVKSSYAAVHELSSLDTAEIQKRLDFLTEVNGADVDTLAAWQAELDTGTVTFEARSQIQKAVNDNINKFDKLNEYLEADSDAILQTRLAIAHSVDSFKELNDLLDEGTITYLEYSQAALDLDKALDTENLDPAELKEYTEYIQKIAPESDYLADSLAKDGEAAQIVAKGVMKMNDAIEVLSSNWESWIDILQHSSKESEEYKDALLKTQSAMADLLDINKDFISEDFIKDNFTNITKAAEGSGQAIDDLKKNLATDVFKQILNNNSEIVSGLRDQLTEEFSEIQTELPDIIANIDVDDSAFVARMQQFINTVGMSVEEANALFDSLGFEPIYEEETRELTERVPVVATTNEVSGYSTATSQTAGVTTIDSRPNWITRTTHTTEEIPKTVTIPALGTNGKTPRIKKLITKANGSFSNSSSVNLGGNGSSNKKSSSKSTKAAQKDERDVYHDINIELEHIGREFERIQKIQERLYGQKLIDNLNKQLAILEKQKKTLLEKQKIQQADLDSQKEQLKNLGVTFDQYGNISNYLSVLKNKQDAVNSTITSYNDLVHKYADASTETERENIEQQIDDAEETVDKITEEYEDLQTKIENYDSLRTDMEDLIDEVDEISQQQIEININKFRMALDIRLETSEAERNWIEFKRNVLNKTDILKDSGFDTIFKDAQKSFENLYSYFNVSGSVGSIQTLTDQLMRTKQEIEEIDSMGQSAIYGDNKAKAIEDLQSDLSELMSQMTDVENYITEIDQAYLDTIGDISEQFDKQIEDYEFIGDLLQHDMDLLTLLYGDKNYAAMDKYYNQLNNNNLKQIDFLRKQADYWKERWDAATQAGESQAAEEFEQHYRNTIGNLNSLINDSAKTLQDDYINAINGIFDALDKKISNGKGTDYLGFEWELMNKNANEYLDTINSAFAIQETERAYNNAINEANSLKNQKRLKSLMDEQLGILRDKENLSQYDVDRAQKLLQIEQARMALEDAQDAKTTMRLKRDSQGNYAYEYVADNDKIADSMDKLAQAQNDLYNFDKEHYTANLNDMLSAWQDFQSKYKEIVTDVNLSEEEKVQRTALLREQYGEYINNKTQDNATLRTNLTQSAFADIAAIYDQDVNNYNQMSQEEQNILMGELVPAWKSGIQEMADTVAGEGGFIPTCKVAFEEIEIATREYENSLSEMAATAGVSLENVKNGVDLVALSMSELMTKNDELITQAELEMGAIENLRLAVQGLKGDYDNVYNSAKNAVSMVKEFFTNQQNQAALAQGMVTSLDNITGAFDGINDAVKALKEQLGIADVHEGDNPSTDTEKGSDALQLAGRSVYDTLTASQNAEKELMELWFERYTHLPKDSYFMDSELTKKAREWVDQIKTVKPENANRYSKLGVLLPHFDTGGYTGNWNDQQGRIALLHQKELVLNEDDTKNFLNTVEILRSLDSSLSGKLFVRSGSIRNNISSLFNPGENIEQNVHIDATFPNVNSKREIEEAFSELVNLAAQRAMKDR